MLLYTVVSNEQLLESDYNPYNCSYRTLPSSKYGGMLQINSLGCVERVISTDPRDFLNVRPNIGKRLF